MFFSLFGHQRVVIIRQNLINADTTGFEIKVSKFVVLN